MEELKINYTYPKSQKILFILIGMYTSLYGLYNCVLQALKNNLALDFYLALAAIVLGVVLLLSVTLWVAKPILRMDANSIYVNMPKLKTVYSSEWDAIKEVGIGVSYLKFTEIDGKDYLVDLSGLKYADLKEVKSRIIELCESKNIPYKND